MIERNIGNAERLVRLAIGMFLGGWMFTLHDINGIDIFVVIISVSLILNGIFSRCYLWYILDINTASGTSSSQECKSV